MVRPPKSEKLLNDDPSLAFDDVLARILHQAPYARGELGKAKIYKFGQNIDLGGGQ